MADGVIEIVSGDLLRAGGTYPDTDFDSAREAIRNDVPEPSYRRGFRGALRAFHRWNGNSWELIPTGIPLGTSKSAEFRIETIGNNRILQSDYYSDEIRSPSGFSGFSGHIATDFHVYSGNKYYGYSEVMYDTLGNAWSKIWHSISSTGTSYVYRNTKDQ